MFTFIVGLMRLLYLPLNVLGSEQYATEAAFRNVFGASNTWTFDFLQHYANNPSHSAINKMLLSVADKFKPDVIHMQLQETLIIWPETLRELRSKKIILTHWCGDQRPGEIAGLLDIAQYFDLVLLSNDDKNRHHEHKKAGARDCKYWQVGYEGKSRPQEPIKFTVPEIVFCGGNYGLDRFPHSRERYEMVYALQEAYRDRFGVVGNGWPTNIRVVGKCYLRQQPQIYEMARVAVAQNHFNDIPLYYSDRLLEAIGSGTPVVARYVPRLEEEFTDNIDCLFWKTIPRLITLIGELLENKPQATIIGHRGRENVLNNHTYIARVRKYHEWVKQIALSTGSA
jgi:hypothetical protein